MTHPPRATAIPGKTALDKMRELTRRLIAVPKSEITPKRKAKKKPRKVS